MHDVTWMWNLKKAKAKNVELIETKSKMVVARVSGGGSRDGVKGYKLPVVR